MNVKQKKKISKILFIILQVALLAAALFGLYMKFFVVGTYIHYQNVGVIENVPLNIETAEYDKNNTYDREWAIYMYMCGSDLESDVAAATTDLEEIFDVPMPEDVTFVIQTGGAYTWYNNYARAGATDRFVYDKDGLNRIYRGENQNMGDEQTLTEFLKYCTAYYPANNIGVVLWDHGGGPIGGVCLDQNFGDVIEMDELQNAFEAAYGRDSGDPALSFIGFDACMMGTIEIAQTLEGYADYLIASEENEGGSGWYYTPFAQALADNPQIGTEELGKVILDAFYQNAVLESEIEMSTLALVDLRKIPALTKALDEFSLDILSRAQSDPTLLARMKRGATTAEQYGMGGETNSIYLGFRNMADMDDLITNIAAETKTEPDAVLAALKNAVVYDVHGETNENASGLSMFFPYDSALGTLDSQVNLYAELDNLSLPLKYLLEYSVTGYISDEGIAYINNAGKDISSETAEVLTIGDLSLEDWAVITEGDNAILELGPEIAANLSDVSLYNFGVQISLTGDISLMNMGTGTRIEKDWENGVFTAVFDGTWVSLGGQPLYADCTYQGRTYALFSAPIKLNGEDYILRFSKDNATGAFKILGAIGASTESNIADRDLVVFKDGDDIKPVSYVMSLEDFEKLSADTEDAEFFASFKPQEGKSIKYSANTLIAETMLPDGYYMEVFMMNDAMGREALSSGLYREISGGAPLDWETE